MKKLLGSWSRGLCSGSVVSWRASLACANDIYLYSAKSVFVEVFGCYYLGSGVVSGSIDHCVLLKAWLESRPVAFAPSISSQGSRMRAHKVPNGMTKGQWMNNQSSWNRSFGGGAVACRAPPDTPIAMMELFSVTSLCDSPMSIVRCCTVYAIWDWVGWMSRESRRPLTDMFEHFPKLRTS